jgi:hypothetical protein
MPPRKTSRQVMRALEPPEKNGLAEPKGGSRNMAAKRKGGKKKATKKKAAKK